ncbi:hypothetical protein C7S16_4337 [Burkholderia thailandensis]|uniref:Secreted protein n=1 Tax=Burkholderia thailandensis TaxID=57975 RepID=A0AAW9CN62_BURTH|nr:hypothetical protein [Burkholderia thailandensis]MDW9252400.1 hypothetical protein [Burkholderia thailandensis]
MFPIWIIDFFSFLFIGGPIEPPHSLCICTRHVVERPSPRGRDGAAAAPRARPGVRSAASDRLRAHSFGIGRSSDRGF